MLAEEVDELEEYRFRYGNAGTTPRFDGNARQADLPCQLIGITGESDGPFESELVYRLIVRFRPEADIAIS